MMDDAQTTLIPSASPAPAPLTVLESDHTIYRVGVWTLSFVSVAAIVGCFILAVKGLPQQETLTTLGSVAIGALSTLVTLNKK